MTRRIIGALVLGLGGVAILVSLGLWQVRRLAWKQDLLTQIDSRIASAPVALPAEARPEPDRFLPVEVTGETGPRLIRVIATRPDVGPGYRVISPFTTEDGRRILLERGFVAETGAVAAPPGTMTVRGNLHWPREVDNLTPPPDLDAGLWYARDVFAMARQMGTEPFLVVAREITGVSDPATPWPVDSSGIPNDHRNYAITWFSLAAIWLVMTGYLIYRIRQQGKAER